VRCIRHQNGLDALIAKVLVEFPRHRVLLKPFHLIVRNAFEVIQQAVHVRLPQFYE